MLIKLGTSLHIDFVTCDKNMLTLHPNV